MHTQQRPERIVGRETMDEVADRLGRLSTTKHFLPAAPDAVRAVFDAVPTPLLDPDPLGTFQDGIASSSIACILAMV